MRSRTHITQKERKKLVLSDFKGVDFSSSPFRVSPSRATEMRNLVNEYGVNHKRHGWREIKNFNPYKYEGSYSVNGIFEYRHGSHCVLLVHAGTRMYRVNAAGGISSDTLDYELIYTGLTDTKSQAFYSKGRLYIVGCGDYLTYGTWDGGSAYEIKSVFADTDTYIPTTTISIDNDSNDADVVRATLDKVNLLTPYRKNQLLGAPLPIGEDGDEQGLIESHTWTLDSGYINAGSLVKIRAETLDGEGNLIILEIENTGNDKTELFLGDEVVGRVDYDNAKITLFVDTTPPVEGADNIFVTFAAGDISGSVIGKCSFGVLFGADGNTDRLFLSGNSDMPNVDFYSEADDYTYFPDRNYCTVGSDISAITGYVRLADSTLIIFKEKYMNEPSLYYRTGSTQIEYDSEGVISDIYGIFPSAAGAMGENLINRHALANFGDDALMLSENGVYGIVLGENARTTERYTRERSRSINEKLKSNNLENATAIVYQNKYYLAVDGVCYVADGRFTFRTSDSLDGAFNYEWWYWDNIPARVFAVFDNTLYFGTADGRVCRFDEAYSDRTYHVCEAGDISYSIDNDTIVYREGISVGENDRITFDTPLYALLQENCSVSSQGISFAEDMSGKIYNGIEVYAENVDGTPLLRETKYYLSDVDNETFSYQLIDENGDYVNLTEGSGGFSLCRKISGKLLYITDVDLKEPQEFSLKESIDGSPLSLIYGEYNQTPQPTAIICYCANVVAEWYSPIMDLGTNESSKTLLKITVCTEPEINGNVSFGYETRRVSKLMDGKGFPNMNTFSQQNLNVFALDSLSFENFTFDCGYASSYSKRVNERNFNFIILKFASDNDNDCAVNDVTLVYKINKSNIGVR